MYLTFLVSVLVVACLTTALAAIEHTMLRFRAQERELERLRSRLRAAGVRLAP